MNFASLIDVSSPISALTILANASVNRSYFLTAPPGTNHLPLAGSFVLSPTSTHLVWIANYQVDRHERRIANDLALPNLTGGPSMDGSDQGNWTKAGQNAP